MKKLAGALVEDGATSFRLWAPRHEWVNLHLIGQEEPIAMIREDRGYFTVSVPAVGNGTRYRFAVDSGEYPDPASRSQPDGVHGPSEVVDFSLFSWTDVGFRARPLAEQVIYELHVGTFTEEGTFAAVAKRLSALAELGVTAIELMPVSEFPGARNWGYDGAYPYAAQSTYGGPSGLVHLVNEAHRAGIAVILDLVMNHFGPEGNYSGIYGHYMTDRYHTPWGDAINFDGPWSDEVRAYFLGCIDHWMTDCHVDGFRLDAIHEIHDENATRFLTQISELVRTRSEEQGKPTLLIAESGSNDRRVLLSPEQGGMGMESAWADDFHHAVHTVLTGEREGYYADFGTLDRLAKALSIGWVNTGEFSPAHNRRHGSDPRGLPARSFVFCTQNHDQVGNRMLGERLVTLVGAAADRAARSLLLLSPYVPLLFMGQEYGERSPFLYFVDHGDPHLLEATREGRAREFAAFRERGVPPDPGAETTFTRSKLAWPADSSGRLSHDAREHTRELLALRSRYDCFRPADAGEPEREREVATLGSVLLARFAGERSTGFLAANLSANEAVLPAREVYAESTFAHAEAAELLSSMERAPGYTRQLLSDRERSWVDRLAAGEEVRLAAFEVAVAVSERFEGLV